MNREILNIIIDRYYVKHGDEAKVLEMELTPREIWGIFMSFNVTSMWFCAFKELHSGDISYLWYYGALLERTLRKESDKNG